MGTTQATLALRQPLAVNQEQAARLLNISPRTLRDWDRKGIVASAKPAGVGGKRLYLMDELRRVAGSR